MSAELDKRPELAREKPLAAGGQLWVITTLAEYQTTFWVALADHARSLGIRTHFLAFDDRSVDMLRSRGHDVSDVYAIGRRSRKYGEVIALPPDRFNLSTSHERLFFRIRDSRALREKFDIYSSGVLHELDRFAAAGEKPVVIQELGGFLSVLATFEACRLRNIDNWFIEPSFFKGRLFLQRNTFGAASIPARPSRAADPELARYLDDTLKDRKIVIPEKDRGHYRAALGKILNGHNIRRLVEKSRDKYLLRKHSDFGYIGTHVRGHLQMLANSIRMRQSYGHLEQIGPFIYYPLHVPADVALTLRSPEYVDQLSLIDYLARIAPSSRKIVTKEHPAQIGAIDARRLQALQRRYDNLVVLPPKTNNYDVLSRADVVVSVNSKSGAEALLIGKPVIVLGDAFYRRSALVRSVDRLSDLPAAIAAALQGPPLPQAEIRAFFQSVWEQTYPGELYVDGAGNIETFMRSLLDAVNHTSQPAPPGK